MRARYCFDALKALLGYTAKQMARFAWFASLTQQGTKPPYLLKFRSSERFIIGTVALAVFTVSPII